MVALDRRNRDHRSRGWLHPRYQLDEISLIVSRLGQRCHETVKIVAVDRTPEVASWLREFGDRLRELRAKQGVSQLQLSAAASLSQPYLSDVEQGRRNPSYVTIRVLAAALDVDPRELLAPPAR